MIVTALLDDGWAWAELSSIALLAARVRVTLEHAGHGAERGDTVNEKSAKAVRKTVRREVQEAEAHLLLQVSKIVLGGTLWSRLRWLVTGRA